MEDLQAVILILMPHHTVEVERCHGHSQPTEHATTLRSLRNVLTATGRRRYWHLSRAAITAVHIQREPK